MSSSVCFSLHCELPWAWWFILEGPLDLPLQGLRETSGPLRGEAACRCLSSVYSYASEKYAREMDLLSAMRRDIRPLSSTAPQKDQLWFQLSQLIRNVKKYNFKKLLTLHICWASRARQVDRQEARFLLPDSWICSSILLEIRYQLYRGSAALYIATLGATRFRCRSLYVNQNFLLYFLLDF